jgi:two-component system chemotaxis sensor kinase CheA
VNVDLKEFRSAFVAEAEEHLSAIQSLLLAIERIKREEKDRATPRELRELMRLLHTMKGLAAMVGVDPIVTLAHRMESVVRTAERAGGVMHERAIEVLLTATRAIEASVHAVSAQRPSPPPSLELLGELDAIEPPPPAEVVPLPLDPVLASKMSASEQQQLRDGARRGRRAVRVDFAPSADKASQGLSITSVRERLGAVAEIVKVVPLTITATEATPGGLVFALVLLTDSSDEQIADAAGTTPDTVTLLVPSQRAAPSAPEITRPFTPDHDDGDSYGEGARDVLRVDVARVDDAIEMLGGLVVTRSRMAHALDRLEESGADTRDLRAILADNARRLRDLRAAILRIRMVPMGAVLERLPLVVRGLARTSGKQVRLELDVGSAELDKTVAERLFPALVHLVRNAVDHGVEAPDERRAAGKSEVATLTIRSTMLDRNVEVRVSDDGRGVDRAAAAAKAGAAVPATDAGLLDLLCRAGLSTRTEVDTTSGRGLGMDIVRKIVVHRLGGELALETQPGLGTTFVLRVPLTVAIVDAFVVRCGGERFAVPVPVVDEIVELAEERLVTGPRPPRPAVGSRGEAPTPQLFARRGRTVPVLDLAHALALPNPSRSPHGLVVRRGADELAAWAVDRVLGQQEIVVRPLVDPLVSSPGIAGSTDLGDGRATLVLDLLSLWAYIGSSEGRAA